MTPTAMLAALAADGPHPALAPQLHLFGQFVGSWDVDIACHRPGGTRQDLAGEWHFGWVLEGRAIQDVWIAPRRELRGEPGRVLGDYGATLRFYDPALGAWRSTWIGPAKGYVMPFVARPISAEIVLEGSFAPGQVTRWIFSDITATLSAGATWTCWTARTPKCCAKRWKPDDGAGPRSRRIGGRAACPPPACSGRALHAQQSVIDS